MPDMEKTKKKEPQAPAKPILATTRLTQKLDHIVEAAGTQEGKWSEASLQAIDEIPQVPGVYCFVLDEKYLPKERMLILHGRSFGREGNRSQLQFRFHYTASILKAGSGLVVYVGKASNLHGRMKGHLSTNVKSTTNQVLRGLAGKRSSEVSALELKAARKTLLENGKVFFFEHYRKDEKKEHGGRDDVGQSLVAERDLLEIKLIAKYAPPFNLKAER